MLISFSCCLCNTCLLFKILCDYISHRLCPLPVIIVEFEGICMMSKFGICNKLFPSLYTYFRIHVVTNLHTIIYILRSQSRSLTQCLCIAIGLTIFIFVIHHILNNSFVNYIKSIFIFLFLLLFFLFMISYRP